MTGGGGLLVCFLGMILGVVICRPQECVRRPQWTIYEDPLQYVTGNVTLIALLRMTSHFGQQQALRMEILHQDLRDYGMTDLSFAIINSKDDRSDEILNNFRRILSFPIYQEEEEEIWKIMGGNDDDMFLYDRCDRLTYYIPHPLSILHDKHPVVRAALLSTYFRSPCGVSCPSNEIADHVKIQLKDTQQILNDNLTDEEAETIHYPNGTGVLVDVEDDILIFGNETTSKGYEEMEDDYPITSYNNSSTTSSISANVSSSDKQITISTPNQKSILSSFFNFIWRKGKQKKSENSVEEIIHESFASNLTNNIQLTPDLNKQTSNSSITEISTTAETTTNRDSKIDSCLGVDENVCLDWSKAKLMRAQSCCMNTTYHKADNRYDNGCKHFSKKRCKKIQPLLKCCLKTEMSVSSPNEPSQGSAI